MTCSYHKRRLPGTLLPGSVPLYRKCDAVLRGFFDDLRQPQRTLHYSDMRFSKEEHTDSGLSGSAAGGIRTFCARYGFLERKLGAFRTSGDLQLTHQGFLIYADSHGDSSRAISSAG